MTDWTFGLAIYFGIGLFICLAITIHHRLTRPRESAFVRDMLDAIDSKRKQWRYRFFEDVFVPVLGFTLVWLFWPLVIVIKIKEAIEKRMPSAKQKLGIPKFVLNEDELIEQVTISEVEAKNMIEDPLEAVPKVPFGHLHPKWMTFKYSIQPDETLWSFESFRSNLSYANSFWGYAIKKDDKIVRFWTVGWKIKKE